MKFWTTTAVLLLAALSVQAKAIEQLDMVTMNRAVELGQETSVNNMQPKITPEHFDAAPAINPSIFELDELVSDPVTFVRALDIAPMTNYNSLIEGTNPRVFDATPNHAPVNPLLDLPSDPVTFDLRMDHSPVTWDGPVVHNPVNYDIRVVIDPINFSMDEIELISDPVAFNRPINISQMVFYNRPIVNFGMRFYNGHIPFGAPRTFNIVPTDEENGTTEVPETTTEEDETPLLSTTVPAGWTPYSE